MTRYGALLRFRPGISRAQAVDALRKLNGLVELGGSYQSPPGSTPRWVENNDASQLLQTYNDEHGGPVWYIP